MERRNRDEKARRAEYGDVRHVIHTDFQGYKIVGVGNTIHWSKNWRTFIDFLLDYLPRVVMPSWGRTEIAKPYAERHVILQWYSHLEDFRRRHRAGPDGISHGVPDGPSRAYLALAYDLYVIADHMKLQERLVARLKHKDQFQGARYELAVAATMVRAGFHLSLENEGDVSAKHPEFRATHKRSKEVIAVEAKSRHRQGVLGRPITTTAKEGFRLGIADLLRKAVAKKPGVPYFIFIDANMSQDTSLENWQEWTQEFTHSTAAVGHGYSAAGAFEGAPFNAAILTNWPDHYGQPGASLPVGVGYISEALNAAIPLRDRSILLDVERAIKQYGAIPTDFPS